MSFLSSIISKSTLQSKYEEWILKNSAILGPIETSLRGLLFLLPGRLVNSEISSEAAYAAVGLFTWYNDSIFLKRVQQVIKEEIQGLRSRVLSETIQNNVPPVHVSSISKWISFIHCFEVLIEMIAQKKGEKSRWTTIFVIENIKVIMRLFLFFCSKGKMVTHQTQPTRDELTGGTDLSAVLCAKNPQTSRKIRPTLMDTFEDDQEDDDDNNKILPFSLGKRKLTQKDLGELLWIVRPILYLIAMAKFGRSSWKPWLLSLLIDISSRACVSSDSLTKVEKEERNRRLVLLLFYVTRSPFWEKFLNSSIGRGEIFSEDSKIKNVWLQLLGYAEAYRQWYFYISGT